MKSLKVNSDNNPLLEIHNFEFRYPGSDHYIFWQGNHIIRKGEKILLSGCSGSGKSTLLYGLMGLIPDSVFGQFKGDIRYRGQSLLHNHPRISTQMGLLLQNPSAQMLCRTVREELAFGMENRNMGRTVMQRKIDTWAERLSIADLLQQRTATLSGGEKQKVALLSILMTEPEIILLDEPTAFLDPESAAEVMEIIKNYHLHNNIIVVEHNLNYLKQIITRNLHLTDKGEVIDRKASDISWQYDLPAISPKEPGEKIITISDLSFSYNERTVLRNIHLNIKKGEIISVTGRNGSGKTTLLKIIAGLFKKYTGKIELGSDEQYSSVKLEKKLQNKCSILFQNPESHFLYNNISNELRNNEIDYLADEFSAKMQQSPFTLSEGEKRRLSTALACSTKKEVLLLDEPTFGQDMNNKLKLLSLLERLRDDGISIVIVSHDLPFVQAAAHRIFKLQDGVLHKV